MIFFYLFKTIVAKNVAKKIGANEEGIERKS